MPLSYIPQHELDEALRQAKRDAAVAPPKTEMRGGDGVVTMHIPQKLFLNATVVHNHPLTDTEYWKDMCRLHPEIKVKYQPRKLRFKVAGDNDRFCPDGKLTRFGRVTFHKRYA